MFDCCLLVVMFIFAQSLNRGNTEEPFSLTNTFDEVVNSLCALCCPLPSGLCSVLMHVPAAALFLMFTDQRYIVAECKARLPCPETFFHGLITDWYLSLLPTLDPNSKYGIHLGYDQRPRRSVTSSSTIGQ